MDQDRRATRGYGATAKCLHWLIALLTAIQYAISALMPEIGPGTRASTLIDLHFSFGLLILAVMAIRFALRLFRPVPLEMPAAPVWERRGARAIHLVFYFVLLVGPFLGWASASAHGLPVSVFGILTLPDIAPRRAHWALTAGDVHIYLMWTLLALIAVHVAAALYHHFDRRDGVLMRMMPGQPRTRG